MLFLGFHFRWAEGVTLSLPLLPAFRTLPAAGGDAVHVFRRIPLKLKCCAWVPVYCSFISSANSQSSRTLST